MKKLKKTRAKLRKEEEVIGQGVPDSLLNQTLLKRTKKSNSRPSSKPKRR